MNLENLLNNLLKTGKIKRNNCIYEALDLITSTETKAIFDTSRKFWQKVRNYLENKNPQLKLFKEF